MNFLEQFFTHPASVRVLGGDGRFGPEYEAARSLSVMKVDQRKMVRNANGEHTVSETTLFLAPDPTIVPGSLLTIDGRERPIITTATHEVPWLGGVLTELALG